MSRLCGASWWTVALLVGCGGGPGAPDAAGADAARPMDGGTEDVGVDGGVDAGGGLDAGGMSVTTALVTDEHRFVPGAMFGGWGPHLGHLVRVGSDLYWVDDLCTQGTGDCDVILNRRIGVFRRDADGWVEIGRTALPGGVQQNTGTIAYGGRLLTYGVDTAAARVVQCSFDPATAESGGCSPLPFDLGAAANYVGAALSPGDARVVWWTNVREGAGTFSYVVEYTVGWNGPRAGTVGGYNDCAYVNAAFRADGPGLTFFGQVVSGAAPMWSFATLVGEASLTTTDPVEWANALAPPPGDAVESTNDLYIDDVTGDAHLIARTRSGAAAYYYRPRGGAFGAPQILDPSALRARWLVTADTFAVVYGPNAGGLRLRALPRSSLTAGVAPELVAVPPVEIPVPPDLGAVVGLYPEADVYQQAPVGGLSFVVVGATRENEAVFFELHL